MVTPTGCAIVVSELSDDRFVVQYTLASLGGGSGAYFHPDTYTGVNISRCNRIAVEAGFPLGYLIDVEHIRHTEYPFPVSFMIESYAGSMGEHGPVSGGYQLGMSFLHAPIEMHSEEGGVVHEEIPHAEPEQEHIRSLQLQVMELLQQLLFLLQQK